MHELGEVFDDRLRASLCGLFLDDARFLTVLAEEPPAAPPPDPRTLHVATIAYRWAQEEALHAACDAAAPPGAARLPLSLGELLELLEEGRPPPPPPHAEPLARADALLRAAAPTAPDLAAGTGAAERTRRDWERLRLFAL